MLVYFNQCHMLESSELKSMGLSTRPCAKFHISVSRHGKERYIGLPAQKGETYCFQPFRKIHNPLRKVCGFIRDLG